MTENINIEELIKKINIEKVDKNINFWMVRTKKGFFYDEFISDGFVALGWNTILEADIKLYKKDKKEKENLKNNVETKYPNNKQITQTINKCDHFINDVLNGDILMIPSAQNAKITFAIAEEYYEDMGLTYEKEIEVIQRIDSKIDYGIQERCPFIKRRKIRVLKTVSGDRLNINLYKVLASYHGLSNIYDYGEFILSTIYSAYYWQDKVNFVFNVEQEKEINARELASFMYNSVEVISSIKNNSVSTKINLNSPGDLILSIIQNGGSNIIEFLNSYKLIIGIIWISIIGGKFAGFEVSSILDWIIKFRESNSKLKNEELDRELKQLDGELKQLEIQGVKEKLDRIRIASETLNINTNAVNNIINLDDHRENNE